MFPAFCLLYCFACGALHLNMALFRILRGFWRGFRVVVWVCLFGCFAWIVGRLCACIVRRLYGLWRVLPFFFSLCPLLSLFLSLLSCFLSCFLCLSSCALLVLSLCGLMFPFPFRTKRKRAHLFCALSLLGFGVFILSYLRQ